jgi:hypothetical protein
VIAMKKKKDFRGNAYVLELELVKKKFECEKITWYLSCLFLRPIIDIFTAVISRTAESLFYK